MNSLSSTDVNFTKFKHLMTEAPSKENGWSLENEVVKKDNPSNFLSLSS